MSEIKEITKEKFRGIVWLLIILGLIINAICYTILTYKLGANELRIAGFLGVGMLICGVGIGLSISRLWIIKGFEKRLQFNNQKI